MRPIPLSPQPLKIPLFTVFSSIFPCANAGSQLQHIYIYIYIKTRINLRSGSSQSSNFCVFCQGSSTWILHRGYWVRRHQSPHVFSPSTWTLCHNSSIPTASVLTCQRRRPLGKMQKANGPPQALRNTLQH